LCKTDCAAANTRLSRLQGRANKSLTARKIRLMGALIIRLSNRDNVRQKGSHTKCELLESDVGNPLGSNTLACFSHGSRSMALSIKRVPDQNMCFILFVIVRADL
jgi:hypothetical protein